MIGVGIRDVDRRLRSLEDETSRQADRTARLTQEETDRVSDKDLEWLASRPTDDAGRAFDFTRWTSDDHARADAIVLAARAGVRAGEF